MKTIVTLLALSLSLPLASALAEEESLVLSDETARINYSVGYQIGGDFKRQGVELDAESVVRGIADALSGAQPKLSQPEMHETLVALKRKIVAQGRAQSAAESEAIQRSGTAFLEENKTREGVHTTDSGLQYKVLRQGTGRSPKPGDTVKVNYRGTTVDGKEFDSSFSRGEPATFNINGVIPGWTEGLQLMKAGGRYGLYVPSGLAYGNRGPLAFQTLIFEIELLEVLPSEGG